MHLEILDKEKQDLLPHLVLFSQQFYLAGGTALALQLGHRKSEDFDFFSQTEFNENEWNIKTEKEFLNFGLKKVTATWQTLGYHIGGHTSLSLMCYPYHLLEPFVEIKGLKLASLLDIGCMKLSAIVSRSTSRDYVDLYMLLNGHFELGFLLEKCKKKFPTLDTNLIIKSLTYFEDMEDKNLDILDPKIPDMKKIQEFFVKEVKKLV